MHFYQPVIILREKGYSLVEFMIAIAISLIIMLAVAIAWQTGFKTQQSQTDVSRLNETVRFAIDLLSREIKQSGLIDKATLSTTVPAEANFCSTSPNGSAIVGANDPASISPGGPISAGHLPTGTTQILNLSDAIRVRYYGADPNAGTQGALQSTNYTYDCLGNKVTTAGTLVEDTLYVAADPNNNNQPTLWCNTSNPNAVQSPLPMVAGVESLQLLYGEDTSSPLDGIVDRYVPWQLVTNPNNILSIKVSIVARSANTVSLDTTAKTFYHFGGSPGSGTPGAIGSIALYTDPTGGSPGTTFTPALIPNSSQYLRLPPMSTEIALRNFGTCP